SLAKEDSLVDACLDLDPCVDRPTLLVAVSVGALADLGSLPSLRLFDPRSGPAEGSSSLSASSSCHLFRVIVSSYVSRMISSERAYRLLALDALAVCLPFIEATSLGLAAAVGGVMDVSELLLVLLTLTLGLGDASPFTLFLLVIEGSFDMKWTMDTTIDQQVAMDEALVPTAQRLKIRRSNFRLLSDIKSKESTLQLVCDVLRICPFFKAFLVTADVSEIYM
nr:hypothetical protein [Tanacetum cinerariifolium]